MLVGFLFFYSAVEELKSNAKAGQYSWEFNLIFDSFLIGLVICLALLIHMPNYY